MDTKDQQQQEIWPKANVTFDSWLKVLPTTRCTCWIFPAWLRVGTSAASGSRATRPSRSSGRIFPVSTPKWTARTASRSAPCAIAREQGRYEEDGWRVRKDGTFFWASVVIDPIYEDGKLIGFAKITRDITERREAQLKLEQIHQQLARDRRSSTRSAS